MQEYSPKRLLAHETNHALNLLKFFACVAVVFIHVTFPGKTGEIIKSESSWAVPFFYMISGYYAFGNNAEDIQRKLRKIVKTFLYAYLLHFAFGLCVAAYQGLLSTWISENFDWKTPIKYIVFCTVDFAIPLWYLIGMIETYLFWLWMVKTIRTDRMLKMTAPLLILRVVMFTFCETKGLAWFWKINFATCALPWFLAGYCFHTEWGRLFTEAEWPIPIVYVLAGAVVSVLPVLLDLKLQFSSAGAALLAVGIFLLACKNPGMRVPDALEYAGSKLSLNIYIFHPIVSVVLDYGMKSILRAGAQTEWYLWIKPVLAALGSTAAALVIQRLKEKRMGFIN